MKKNELFLNKILVLFVTVLIVATVSIVANVSYSLSADGTVCGNMMCEPGEDQNNCPQDCQQQCVQTSLCDQQCGSGMGYQPIGGGACYSDSSCSQQCGQQNPCNNNQNCEPGENPMNCPSDCGSESVCGNMMCEPNENSQSCPQDCGSGSQCGNNQCEPGEDQNNCPNDCGMSGGNYNLQQEMVAPTYSTIDIILDNYSGPQSTMNYQVKLSQINENAFTYMWNNGGEEGWQEGSVGKGEVAEIGNHLGIRFRMEDTGYHVGDRWIITVNWNGGGSQCGNNQCEPGEDQNNCPQDCQQQNQCNHNSVCEQGENSGNCPSDCGVRCGSIITTNTILNSDLFCDTTALNIGADNVVLDCAGHTITHTGIGSGIDIGNHHYYITIKNCNIIGNTSVPFITVGDETNSTTISYNIGIAVWSESDNNTIIDNTLSYNNTGIHIFDRSNYTLIANNTVNSNYDGIVLDDGVNNTVTNNTIINNTNEGIVFHDSQDNLIYNNFFNNIINTQFAQQLTIYLNYWNTALAGGANIIGGTYLGGNFWGNPMGTGFSQTCSDSNLDGICDSAYILATDNIDYLPLTADKSGIVGSEGGTIATGNGNATLIIPQDALNDDTIITLVSNSNENNYTVSMTDGEGIILSSYGFYPSGQTFTAPITITLAYEQGNMSECGQSESQEDKLDIYYNDPVSGWIPQGAIKDCVNNKLTLQTTHFSEYAVIAPVDNDSDGYPLNWNGIVDCNDNNPNIHPGATEICNGVDDNCNGIVDEELTRSANESGECSINTQTCSAGAWIANNEYSPTFEIPGNNLDENCDSINACNSSALWKNHGEFVSCVTKEAQALYKARLITEGRRSVIVNSAAKSDVGKK